MSAQPIAIFWLATFLVGSVSAGEGKTIPFRLPARTSKPAVLGMNALRQGIKDRYKELWALEVEYDLGVDFVLDAAVGPVVLEANARPGLAIQLANRRGLAPRLRLVDAEPDNPIPPDRRRELVSAIADMN